MQDFSASSHILLRLRLLHPVAAVVGCTYVFWLLWSLWRKQDHSPWMFGLTAALTTQIALGAMNVMLLAPIWLQMMHLLVAEMVWILLVLASAELLLSEQSWWPFTRTDAGPTSEVASRSRLTVKPLPRMLCNWSFFRCRKGACVSSLR